MKKFLLFILLLLTTMPVNAYTEENTILDIISDGAIVKMIDGSMYRIWDYDTPTTMIWLPGTYVVITDNEIINVDDNEAVEYQYRMR